MIFVDVNVPMYLVGDPHPNKARTLSSLLRLARDGEVFITDVEVYQEILHRYQSLRRLHIIDAAIHCLNVIVADVLTYGMPEIGIARDLIRSVPGISARDALHAAVMRQAGISRIFSYDTGFDRIPGIERLE